MTARINHSRRIAQWLVSLIAFIHLILSCVLVVYSAQRNIRDTVTLTALFHKFRDQIGLFRQWRLGFGYRAIQEGHHSLSRGSSTTVWVKTMLTSEMSESSIIEYKNLSDWDNHVNSDKPLDKLWGQRRISIDSGPPRILYNPPKPTEDMSVCVGYRDAMVYRLLEVDNTEGARMVNF